jgi:hypothetical protein
MIDTPGLSRHSDTGPLAHNRRMTMGLIIDVYRNGTYDCTMRGISSPERAKRDQLCIVNIPGPFEPSADVPAAMLVHNNVFGDHRPLVKIVPALRAPDFTWEKEKRWTMFGGNYGATSDSRFSEAVADMLGTEFYSGAVKIHDRIEG